VAKKHKKKSHKKNNKGSQNVNDKRGDRS
jgi:hypothetical protein